MAPKKYRQKVKQQKQSQATPHEPHHHHKKGKDRRSLYLSLAVVVIVVIVIGAIAASGLSGNGGSTNPTASPSPTTVPTSDDPYVNSTYVFFHTSMGNFTVQLRNDMPITVGNFINHVNQGTYNGTTFHRVKEGFMIQTGIPADGSSPSTIQDEFTTNNHNYNGTLAMANVENVANSGSSQFFINVEDNNYLDSKHPQFGKVIYGWDVVLAISQVPTDSNWAPINDVTIIGAWVIN